MRRVAVTGVGAVSALGSQTGEIAAALRDSRSGLAFNPEMQALGFKCQVYAPVRGFDPSRLDRHALQSMTDVAQYAVIAGLDALADAGLDRNDLPTQRTGVVVGTVIGGAGEAARVEQTLLDHRHPRRSGATGIVKMLNSAAASHLAAQLGVQGRTYSFSSACASGPDSIGHAYELIAFGVQDVMLAGAAEEDTWKHMGPSYDNWSAMPTAFNGAPEQACRPYDVDHAGFVLAAGAAILVLEELESARRRDAPIYAEIVGYGSSNDGVDMIHPTGQGARRATLQALSAAAQLGVTRIEYLNPHGAGTPVGDAVEVAWIKDVFSNAPPAISSTKGLAGHAMGAAGALEAAYTLLMMREGFIAPTMNLDRVAADCEGVPHVRTCEAQTFRTALSVNAGLGGANASLIFRKV